MNFYTCFHNAYGKKWRPAWKCIPVSKPEVLFRYPIAIFMRTNLVVSLFALFCLMTSSAAYSQSITISVKNASLENVFKLIEKQSGYLFWCDNDLLKKAKPVDLSIKNASLTQALDACFKDQTLTYVIKGKTIVVKAKAQSFNKNNSNQSGTTITGLVQDEKGLPMPSVTIRVEGTDQMTITDTDGRFLIEVPGADAVLEFSFIGFANHKELVNGNTSLKIILKEGSAQLNDVSVISTGYQTLPKERATGSFVQLDNTLLNRRVSTNILDRIDGIAPGVYFNGQGSNTIRTSGLSPRNPGINIRGQSTINAPTDPLIVLDNFPYEGEISNINPNDIESITILKDAAAASIWGAKAGNGVIVITTKKGRFNQKLQIDLNTNVTIGNKPDLYYDKNYLTSPQYIEVEKYLFNAGLFNSDIDNTTSQTPVSPVIDILALQRLGFISANETENRLNALRGTDVRSDFDKYVYQKSVSQQYSLGFRGGSDNVTYALSVGYDNNKSNVVTNGFNRTSVNSLMTYKPLKNLEITAGLNYSVNNTQNNNTANLYGSNYLIGGKYSNIFPYARLGDDNGNALAIVKDYKPEYIQTMMQKGFLDWTYRPLDEINFADQNTNVTDMLLRVGARYKIIQGLNAEINYQRERQLITSKDNQNLNRYYTRNLINTFGQYSSSTNSVNFIFPAGDILTKANYDWSAYNIRGQLNYSRTFGRHQIDGLAGAEVRETETEGYLRTSYGYNDQFGTAVTTLNYNTAYPVNPSGTSFINSPDGSVSGSLNRFVSYYANVGYTYNGKYTFTLSGRKDGANIFGANTNDKVTPLWSAGLGWNISKENFYNFGWLPYLKLRASYGYNGNVYNGSAYLTGTYLNSSVTGANMIQLTVAPNPELRWEKIQNTNLGIDFAALSNRISGSIELYLKNGKDLLQRTQLATQTGFTNFLSNSASMRTRGLDLSLTSQNLTGNFKWSTNFIFSTLKDKIIKYDVVQTATLIQTVTGQVPIQGQSLYGIYSYKWAGLDPVNGDPQGYLIGQVSKNYTAIINNYKPDSLVYKGNSRPGIFGSLRNDFSYKGFNLSFNIVYKFNYYIRKPSLSLNYQDLLGLYQNSDYALRWQKPGDELMTSVPSLVYPSNTARNTFYQYSEALVRRGDHIRLQDIRLGYDVPKNLIRNNLIRKVQVYSYASNLGILWRANKNGIDPDNYGFLGSHALPNPFTIAFGLNATF